MAGHSKWANIRHRKGAQDAKRGKIFTKLIREITISAKMGGADVTANPRLRAAIDKALSANMTRDTIDRAVKRGSGDMDGDNVEEIRYEGYGVAGVAVMVDCMTDNRNRTVAEVRHAFTKTGGNLGTDGSVSYLFEKQGQFIFGPDQDEERIMELALEAGADDVISSEDGSIEVRVSPDLFPQAADAFKGAKVNLETAEVTMIASTQVPITDADTAQKLMKLVDILEDLDDVQEVYTNADISDEVLAAL